jgi:hypothetical protein
MFETLPQHAQHPQPFQLFQQQSPHFHTPWMPASPSPLGSCNANIPRAAIFSSKMGGSGTNNQTATTTGKENHIEGNTQNLFSNNNSSSSTSSPRQSTFEQRFKSASSRPFARIFGSSSSEDGTAASARANKHRALFLNKVKQGRETSRFNARGESVMMMEHLSEQKDWRETMQRKADAIYQQYHLEEGEMSGDDDVVDCEQYALEMQEQEMDALLENMPADNNNNNKNGLTSPAKSVRSFCGDDEDAELEGLFDQFTGDYSQDMDMSG